MKNAASPVSIPAAVFPGRMYAILMASGFSRRFGEENKLLVPFRGKPLARHTLELVCGLHCFHRVFFVAAEKAVLALAGDLPVTAVRNSRPERGQRESIRLGVEAAALGETENPGESAAERGIPGGGDGPGGTDPAAAYYMFFPCDQPLLDADTVRRIVKARCPGCIVQPCYRGEPGNPALFSALFRDELLSLGEGERGRDLIRRHPENLVTVEITEPPFPPSPRFSPLTDIDDPQTLARFEKTG